MTSIIAFPLDKILKLITILATVKDGFNFIFQFIIHLDWNWRWWIYAVNVIATPR